MADPLPKPASLEAELITDISELVENYSERNLNYSRAKAAQEFFIKEVKPICAYKNDRLTFNQGHLETILAGQWVSHPEIGLYVRLGTESNGITLAQNHSFGRVLGWNYEWRGDREEKGFLYLGDGFPLTEIKKTYDLATKFTQALEGYHEIVQARQ